MIVGDKNLLTATLTQGVLAIQQNLVQLYSTNLNGMAIQAALIANFAFAGFTESAYEYNFQKDYYVAYLFYVVNALCLISSIYIVSQSAIVVIFGPTSALNGDSAESVSRAVHLMREQQTHIFVVGIFCLFTLFFSTAALLWNRCNTGPAALGTIAITYIFYLTISEGQKSYLLFQHESTGS